MPIEEYRELRKGPTFLQMRTQLRGDRRISLGPVATLTFECYDSVWFQVQEMVAIEKGGLEQFQDEINAYKDLVPSGNNLGAFVLAAAVYSTCAYQFIFLWSHSQWARSFFTLKTVKNAMLCSVS